MKSRIAPKQDLPKKLIGCSMSETAKSFIEAYGSENGIKTSFVGAESAGRTLGELVGAGSGGERYEGTLPQREILIMSGLKSTAVDRLLNALRAGGVRIELKCVVTPVNINWTLGRLAEEIIREHEAMHGL